MSDAKLQYVEDFFELRTTQMHADHLPQLNGLTRTDSYIHFFRLKNPSMAIAIANIAPNTSG
jgi:hypothetical protein